MTEDRHRSEREIVERHIARSYHGPRRFGDGSPEFGSPEFEALSYAKQLELAELRSGIFRGPGDESLLAVPTIPPRPYDAGNPIDTWRM